MNINKDCIKKKKTFITRIAVMIGKQYVTLLWQKVTFFMRKDLLSALSIDVLP